MPYDTIGGSEITLVGVWDYAHTISAIKEIRRSAGWGLGEAKEAVDRCLSGERSAIRLLPDLDVAEVVSNLNSFGFVVEVGGVIVQPTGEPYQPSWAKEQTGSVVVRELRDLRSEGLMRVTGRVVSGAPALGERLGLPLSGSSIVVAPIVRVVASRESVILDVGLDSPEDYALWNAMNVIGEDLPVLVGEIPESGERGA